ncbi:MAG: beta-ketoacyl-[acyl-carrier-protein] synthase II, partial [Planctomycetes bacterium]|nr:beta-ketoacyl-[acyl-carrier-protein] synthase II [Planctomycetota bacterium]
EPAQGIAAVTQALRSAQVEPAQIDYINAHATSTSVGDVCEARILQSALGTHVDSIPISSTKSMTGHLLSAAAAVEAVACLAAIDRQMLPATINLDSVDPECAMLRHIPHQAIEGRVDVAVSNSFGFGGNNTSMVLRKVA